MKKEKHNDAAKAFAVTQQGLTDRTDAVIETIIELPNGEQDFKKEIAQLTNAANAMNDAEEILETPNTGPEAIAAETEAIEWLLMAKRSGGGGGGGGGSPGNGNRNGGSSSASALALLGRSDEKKAKVQGLGSLLRGTRRQPATVIESSHPSNQGYLFWELICRVCFCKN